MFYGPREALEMFGARPELTAADSRIASEFEAETGKRTYIAVDGGVRDSAKQAALYADSLKQGNGTLAYPVGKPGESRHEYGSARDRLILAADNPTEADYRKLAVISARHGLVNRFGRPEYDPTDKGHGQLDEPLEVAKAEWAKLQKKNCLRWCSHSSRSPV